MNVTLLDKSLSLHVLFSRAIMCLHKPTHREYQLYVTDRVPVYTKPCTVEEKIYRSGCFTAGWGIHHKALTFRTSRKHSERLFLTSQFNLLQTCTSEVQELVGQFRLTWKITYRLQELITLKTPP